MRKTFKKLAAVALASAMTLSSSVMASAATMNVYVRKWTQTSSTNTYEGTVTPNPFGLNPVVKVKGVTSGMTYKAALEKAESVGLNTTWDKKNPNYLTSVGYKNFLWENNGANHNVNKDDKGNTIGAIWKGDSWMWYEGEDLQYDVAKYPNTTLGETYVPAGLTDSSEFSMVLSYDHSEFSWGTPATEDNQ